MIWQYLRKEKQGQIGERNKTIILLRASTVTKPPEGARGRRSGSVGQLDRLSNQKPQRTQQNDIGFVALAGRGQPDRPSARWKTCIKFTIFRTVKRAKKPHRGRVLRLTFQKSEP